MLMDLGIGFIGKGIFYGEKSESARSRHQSPHLLIPHTGMPEFWQSAQYKA